MYKVYDLKEELIKLEKLGVQVGARMQIPGVGSGRSAKEVILNTQTDLPLGANGLFFQVEPRTSLSMAIVTEVLDQDDLAVNLVVVLVEGRRSEKVQRLSPVKDEGDKKYFVRLVSTWLLADGRSYSTKPMDNSLRIVSVREGLLQIFSVAIVSRLYNEKKGAYHFLVVQEMYKAKLYRDKTGKVVVEVEDDDDIVTSADEYPGFNNWPAMQALVDEMVPPAERKKLPLLKSRRKRTLSKPLKLGENEAEIIFFDINKGFGFARVADGRGIYFNWQNSASEDRLPYFFSGQKVIYDEIRVTDRGEQLIGVKAA